MERKSKGLYLADVKREYKGKTYHSYLLRRSYREGKKVKQKTLANLSLLPLDTIEIIKKSLKYYKKVAPKSITFLYDTSKKGNTKSDDKVLPNCITSAAGGSC